MSRGAGAPCGAWGCEREQGAGSTGEADGGDRRESLAATGMDLVCNDDDAVISCAAKPGQAGGDRRIAASRRRDSVMALSGLAEAAS